MKRKEERAEVQLAPEEENHQDKVFDKVMEPFNPDEIGESTGEMKRKRESEREENVATGEHFEEDDPFWEFLEYSRT